MQQMHIHTLAELPPIGATMGVRYRGRPQVMVSTVQSGDTFWTRVNGPLGLEHFPGSLPLERAAGRYWLAESVQ